MKKIAILSLGIAMAISGCKKAEELTQFDIDYTTTVTIPSTTGVNLPFNIYSPDMETNSSSKFESNNTRKDKIESIILKKMELVIKSPSNGDFDFLKSIELYIDADGLDEKKIAFKNPVPDGSGKTITLDLSGDELKAYILKANFSLRVNTVTDEVISNDHVIDINTTLFVDAKLL